MSHKAIFASLVVFVLTLSICAHPCSFASGYFHQVTSLRGTIVGVDKGNLRHMIRWARQRTRVRGAKLSLYEYRYPIQQRNDMPFVKAVFSDSDGHFDFGALATGHYELIIDTPWGWSDWYDVEIVKSNKTSGTVLIDVSPIYPDCSGGHEFIVSSRPF